MSHDLKVERWFDAAPEEVFDAYTDPVAQKVWYEDQPGWIVEAECDLRVGGRWVVTLWPARRRAVSRDERVQGNRPTQAPRLYVDGHDAGRIEL